MGADLEFKNYLDTVNTDIQEKKKEFFSSIDNVDIVKNVKEYFSSLNKQETAYFEDNSKGKNQFLIDMKNFLDKNSISDLDSFYALTGSIVNRKLLSNDIKIGKEIDLLIKNNKSKEEEFAELISKNIKIDNLKSYKNIKEYFEKSTPENISKMLDFVGEYPNYREKFINKEFLEQYLSEIYKNGKINVGFNKETEEPTFTIVKDLSISEKRALVTYGILFGNQIKKQDGLLDGDNFKGSLRKGDTNEGNREFTSLEAQLLNSLFIIKGISDNINEKQRIFKLFNANKKTEEKVLKNKDIITYKDTKIEEKIENNKKSVLEKIFERAGVEDEEKKEILYDLLENKIDLQSERINLKLLTPGDLGILKEQGFFLGSLFLIGENGKMATKESILEEGNKFIVDFGGNSSLEKTIGAGDLLIPYNIDSDKDYPIEIKINNKQTGKLDSVPRVGFYNGRKYRPIYSDYIVEIKKVGNISNPDEYKESFDERNILFRREQVREYIKSSILSGEVDLKPLTKSKIDNEAFRIEIESLNSDFITFNKDDNIVHIDDLENIKKEYLYPIGYGKGDGGFKSMSDKQADIDNKKDSYWCSYIARKNAEQFGIKIPQGDAKVAQYKYTAGVKSKKGVLEVKDFDKGEFNGGEVKGSDFIDIFMSSPTKMGKKYGHRAVGYKWGGEWYVLDTYYNKDKKGSGKRTNPIKMSEYLSYMRGKGYGFERVAYYDSLNISVDEMNNGNDKDKNIVESSLNLKEKTIQLIKKYEGFSRETKWDIKQYTRGYGTKSPGKGAVITREKAEQELRYKIEKYYYPTIGKYTNLGDNQKAALTSFVFNLGTGILDKNGWDRLIKGYPNTREEIAAKIRLYNKVKDRNGNMTVSAGLKKRRDDEAELFLKA